MKKNLIKRTLTALAIPFFFGCATPNQGFQVHTRMPNETHTYISVENISKQREKEERKESESGEKLAKKLLKKGTIMSADNDGNSMKFSMEDPNYILTQLSYSNGDFIEIHDSKPFGVLSKIDESLNYRLNGVVQKRNGPELEKDRPFEHNLQSMYLNALKGKR